MAKTAIARKNRPLGSFDEVVRAEMLPATVATGHAQIDRALALEGSMQPLAQ
jgi:hypothetical protein